MINNFTGIVNKRNISKANTAAGRKFHTRKKITYSYVKKNINNALVLAFKYTLIICISYMILYPLLRMISVTFTHPYDYGSLGSIWIPASPTIDNLKIALIIMDYSKSVLYTTVSTLGITLLQIFNAALAGYSFARLRFRGSGILFALVIFTIIVPPASVMLPQYVYFRNFDILGIFKLITGEKLNLLGNPASMMILAAMGQGVGGGLFIYIFRQFFKGLPKELEESAYVDGASFPRIFFRIVMPLSKPAILTVGVLSFVWNWNDTYFPQLFNPSSSYLRVRLEMLRAPSGGTSNVQLAIGNAISRIPPDVTRLSSASYDAQILTVCSLLVILPLIVFFIIAQKHFIEGVERSGIVG
ncbi:MAG: carbohydrate ABC transporter permease [Clostridiales bacterium]|jgi:multiple sugar transport system permease protein|nr:carbohydrate ABC transporter permease [Clostridiales bacterium]